MRNWGICGIAGLLLAVVAFVYWPVVHFDFVWDDWQSFHDTAWLTRGGDWEHYVFRDFNNWTVYFRPLVVAFLALQVHVFDSTPGPMHVVSLALHLIDTLLVGALAWRCSLPIYKGRPQQIGMASLSMLVYGLHPVLVEPVAWIGCQYDLMATMFMLLGLLLNACIQPDAIRAPVIGLIFFLAACSKESAMSFPFLVLIFDWALAPNEAPFQPISAIRNIIRQRWKTYAGIIVAGLLYLALRNWGLGGELGGVWDKSAAANSTTLVQRLQEICVTYLHYWRTLFWPMPEMGPLHIVDTHRFALVSASSLAICAVSLSIVTIASYLAVRRASPFGAIVLAATAALLPVLHIFPVTFDISFCHERYTMTALSVVCAMLPLVLAKIPTRNKFAQYALAIVVVFWFLLAAVDIRTTLPKWSNDISLWRWALAMYPHASDANNNLMTAYFRQKDYADLAALEDQQLEDPIPCLSCMLTVANNAADLKDSRRAILALGKVSQSQQIMTSHDGRHLYYLALGKVLMQQGRLWDAEKILENSESLSPQDTRPRLVLADDLAQEGKSEAARQLGEPAIQELPENQRSAATQVLNEAIEIGRKNNATPQDSQNGRPSGQ